MSPFHQGLSARDIKATDLLLILIVSLVSVKVLAIFLLGFIGPPGVDGYSPSRELVFTVSIGFFNALVVLMAIHAFALRRYGLGWGDLGMGPFERGFIRSGTLAGILCLALVFMVTKLIEALMGGAIENPQLEALSPVGQSWGAMLVFLVLSSIIVPIAEEIAFRGLFYRWLRPRLGIPGAVLVSAILFAVLHGIPHLIPAFMALGIALAILAEKTGSIWPAIIAHGTYNAFMTFALFSALQMNGGPP